MALAVYVLVTFGFSWAIALALHAAGGFSAAGPFLPAILLAYMFGPALGAVAASLPFERGRFLKALSLRQFRVRPVAVWTLYGWFVPILLCALALAATLVLTGQGPADAAQRLAGTIEAQGIELPMSAHTLLILTLALNVPIGIVLNTVVITLNEELGWRGFLQPKLAGLGFWPMSILIGAVWGIWHAPVVLMGHNYPGLGWSGVALMTGWTILVTPYLSLARERSGHVLPAGAFHGSINAVAGVSLLYAPQTAWPWNGILGLGGFGVLVLGWIAIWLYRRARPLQPAR